MRVTWSSFSIIWRSDRWFAWSFHEDCDWRARKREQFFLRRIGLFLKGWCSLFLPFFFCAKYSLSKFPKGFLQYSLFFPTKGERTCSLVVVVMSAIFQRCQDWMMKFTTTAVSWTTLNYSYILSRINCGPRFIVRDCCSRDLLLVYNLEVKAILMIPL